MRQLFLMVNDGLIKLIEILAPNVSDSCKMGIDKAGYIYWRLK